MACCLYWCTDDGPVEVTSDADGNITPPAHATSGPYRSLEEAALVCPSSTCEECLVTFSAVATVSLENTTGAFFPTTLPLYIGLLNGTDPCFLAAYCWIPTNDECNSNPGGTPVPGGGPPMAIQLFMTSLSTLGAGTPEFWNLVNTACSVVPTRDTTWISLPAGWSTTGAPGQITKNVNYPCGTANFIESRRLLGRIRLSTVGAGVGPNGNLGEADVYVQP